MFRSLASLYLLVSPLWSYTLWAQEETWSVGERPWALTAQVAPDFGNGVSGVEVATERRLLGSPSKYHQVGIRFGAQHLNIAENFDVIRGQGLSGGAFLLLGKTHFIDLHAGGSLVYDSSSEGTPFFIIPTGGAVGWKVRPLVSAGYRYISAGPEREMIKVGIGTLGVYVGYGIVLK